MRTEDQKENEAKKLIQTGKQQDSKRYDDFSTTAEEERESKRRREYLELNARANTIFTRLERYADTSSLRRRTAKWVMWIVSLWLAAVIVVLVCAGLEWVTLSNRVLIALLTTTTVNILGLPLVVLRGLYPKEEEIDQINDNISEIRKISEGDPPKKPRLFPKSPPLFSKTPPVSRRSRGAFCDIHRQNSEKQAQSRHKATYTTAEITNFAQTLIHNNTMDFTFKSFIQVLSCGFALLASAFRAEPPKGSQPIDEMRKNMERKMTLTDKQRTTRRLESRQRRPNARMD